MNHLTNATRAMATVLALVILGLGQASAQDFTKLDTLKFSNILQYRMINKGFTDSETPFFRIPAYLKDSVRHDLWDRQKCTSGIAFRFRTNSRAIGLRYNLLTNMHMMHMADTGIKGAGLYILDGDKWQFLNCNRPVRYYTDEHPRRDSIQTKVFVDRLDGKMHEYMLYLPLYDGVNWMEIGVDSTAIIDQPAVDSPRRDVRFVFYGTSILQGGCATRPGMVATSILQRWLDAECINLGFSGEGKMDYCMARAMAKIPNVKAFIIDPVPNCTKMMCDTLTYGFINILRKARPDVPIIMVEGPIYSYANYSAFYGKYLREKNYEFHKNYLKLKQENPKNLYYVSSDNLWGPDNEGTVDGIHLTDVGFYYYALTLKPYLEAVLNGTAMPNQQEVDKPYKPIDKPGVYTWE